MLAASSGAVSLGADSDFVLQQHVAGVHAGVDAHGGEAGNRFAVDDGPVDRGRAAIFRQQGSVKIDPAEFRNGQQARGNDLAVGDDDDGSRARALREVAALPGSEFFRVDASGIFAASAVSFTGEKAISLPRPLGGRAA